MDKGSSTLYSGPVSKRRLTRKDTPLEKDIYLAAYTMIACNAPSHRSTPLSYEDKIDWQMWCPYYRRNIGIATKVIHSYKLQLYFRPK